MKISNMQMIKASFLYFPLALNGVIWNQVIFSKASREIIYCDFLIFDTARFAINKYRD